MKEEKAFVRLCVVGIVYKDRKILMLKRTSAPYNWCPPCGGVRKGENIVDAVKREITEETQLTIDVGNFVEIWQGKHDGEDVVSITYLCKANTEKIILSSEHEDYKWVDLDTLSKIPTDFDVTKWSQYIEND